MNESSPHISIPLKHRADSHPGEKLSDLPDRANHSHGLCLGAQGRSAQQLSAVPTLTWTRVRVITLNRHSGYSINTLPTSVSTRRSLRVGIEWFVPRIMQLSLSPSIPRLLMSENYTQTQKPSPWCSRGKLNDRFSVASSNSPDLCFCGRDTS